MSTLAQVVADHLPYLQGLTEAQASYQPAPGVWSAKQILGHLIDSGVNNHARFVRAAAEDGLRLPGYDQTAWVASGGYQERPWAEVLALWAAYQTQLAQVIATLPAASLEHTLSIGGGESITLRFVAEDYVRHHLHHLGQIPGRVGT
ncbi:MULTISPECIES: DinB family protein [Deinococcus]|uniref:DinB family protein n=1 Tax=Deinococcus rufus TaxID=2136097 RepID=A0ABV7Z8Y6_9DEIO|nr:DinB family protein [Deinococcus sp. AB2017081]WQE95598.1 DinB family protein [Deinococcus sp. AB2017081]